jgi:hypothetical protein
VSSGKRRLLAYDILNQRTLDEPELGSLEERRTSMPGRPLFALAKAVWEKQEFADLFGV